MRNITPFISLQLSKRIDFIAHLRDRYDADYVGVDKIGLKEITVGALMHYKYVSFNEVLQLF